MNRRGAGPSRTVPRTSLYWEREVRGVFVMLDGLPQYDLDFGRRWCLGMRAHYLRRLRELYADPPTNILRRGLRPIPRK